jgi:amino acid adenylation domain-containing protein
MPKPIGAPIGSTGRRRTARRPENGRGPASRRRPAPRRRATVVDWFEATVGWAGERVAVSDGRATLTYAGLDAAATRLAHHLRARGVGPDVPVGLCLDRSVALLVALLGILKAGGAYVPLDPTYPPDRLRFMVADAGLPLVVTDAASRACLPPDAVPLLLLDALGPAPAPRPPRAAAGPAHLAYVLYTSGSTGTPKGVEIPHAALFNFLAAMRATPGLGPADVLLAVTTLAFDIAALELLLPLVVGARIELVARAVAADGRALAHRLATARATVLQATPVTWRMLLEAGWPGDPRLTMLCGGEALPHDLATALLARGGALWNLYGPTETTVWSAVHRVTAAPGPVPLGAPIARTTLHVLDPHLAPAAEGELCIGGAGLARGYRGRPALTADRFVPDPFGPPGARLYRTGDLVRRRPDGTLDFLGRLDHQVKLHGFRIELGEIETVLRRHPAVADAVVVPRPTPAGDDLRLVAYLRRRTPGAAADPPLRPLAAHWLPAHMVPATFCWLDALPTTPNGKLDRAALPAPEEARPALATPFAAPARDAEAVLAQIWSSVLGVPDPGIDDSFFDLGGTSLLLLRVRDAIAGRVGHEVALAELFRRPTIRALAPLLDAGAGVEPAGGHRDRARRRRLALGGDATDGGAG